MRRNLVENRLMTPDLLKGVAVVLMVQVHLMELFATEVVRTSLAGKISLFLGGPPAAPLFMAVMGYFVARSSKGVKHKLLQGLKLIVWGFMLNLGLNAHLLLKIWQGVYLLDPLPYIFGVDILFLAGISVILLALLGVVFGDRWMLWMIPLLAFGFANPYLPVYAGNSAWITYLQAYFWGYFHWAYFPVFPWAAYPVAGYVFYLLLQAAKAEPPAQHWLWAVTGLLFVLLAATFAYGFSRSTILLVYYHHNGVFMLWTLAFLLFILLLVYQAEKHHINNPLTAKLAWVGRHVTAFYVFQWLIIGNVATAIYQSHSWIMLALWFVVVMGVCSLLVWAWQWVKPRLISRRLEKPN
ncbi:MAG: acyltransferase [Bacteroidetes bacterium]|nr:acyltransferase [Bacteroidota bacterium]